MGIIVVLGVVITLLFVLLLALLRVAGKLMRKVGPNEALIVYGTGGISVTIGGGRFVLPLYQKAEVFSLESVVFSMSQSLLSVQGIAVKVEAVTHVKVRADERSVKIAAQQFLSKPQKERERMIIQVMEGHLSGVVGQLTIEDLVRDPERVSQTMFERVSSDVVKMGLEVVTFIIRVRDENEYIINMGRPQAVEMRKKADVATAHAQRDTQIEQANAARESAIAKAQAEQERVKAEAESLALQAEYKHNLALKQLEFEAELKRQRAIADKAYDMQANLSQQEVIAEAVKITEIEKQAQIKVQEAEIQRRELELQATVLKPAEAAHKRLLLESESQARAAKARGVAEAEVARAHGLAEVEVTHARNKTEAEAIRAKGEAEAEAMKLKADAFHNFNEAAILDKLIGKMPEVARALAEPLGKVDKVTIIATGTADNGSNGHSLGASRLTNEIVNMTAQVPAIFESVSGVRFSDLISRVPGFANKDNESAIVVKANARPQDGLSSENNESK